MASTVRDRECTELLLERGIDPNSTGFYYGTALQAALRVGDVVIVDKLLNCGADVNIVRGAHGTALRAAVTGGHGDIVRHMVACGADVNLRHHDKGNSILRLVLDSGSYANFQALLLAGADTDTRTFSGQHIMITACNQGDATAVQLLLNEGANPSVLGSNGPMMQILLDHNADINATDQDGNTVLASALSSKKYSWTPIMTEEHLKIINLLLDHGRKIRITERDLLAAADLNRLVHEHGKDVVSWLIEYDDNAVLTEEVNARQRQRREERPHKIQDYDREERIRREYLQR
ncbi:MAG: hypothetical protein Q9213_003790 [Squamulea squamosa]